MSTPVPSRKGRWWLKLRNAFALGTLTAGSNQSTAAPPPADAPLPQSPTLQPTAPVRAGGPVPSFPHLSLTALADPPQSLVASAPDMDGPFRPLPPSHFAPSAHNVLALRRRNSCSNIGAVRRPRSRERGAHTPHPYHSRSPRSEDDASDAKSPLSPSTRGSSRGRSRRGSSSRGGALSHRSATSPITSPVYAPGALEDELDVFDTFCSRQLDSVDVGVALSPRALLASNLSPAPPPD